MKIRKSRDDQEEMRRHDIRSVRSRVAKGIDDTLRIEKIERILDASVQEIGNDKKNILG